MNKQCLSLMSVSKVNTFAHCSFLFLHDSNMHTIMVAKFDLVVNNRVCLGDEVHSYEY